MKKQKVRQPFIFSIKITNQIQTQKNRHVLAHVGFRCNDLILDYIVFVGCKTVLCQKSKKALGNSLNVLIFC